jgi:outer membrane scaffolding protein for murein synthesis (MipA/OmpV family)
MKLSKIIFCLMLALFMIAGPVLAAQHTVGVGAGFAPDYEGSDEYEGVPMLMLTGKYDSGRSFSLLGPNLRVNVLASNKFQFGPILNYRMGRDDVENKRVDRMKDIDDAMEAGAFVLANFDNVLLGVDFLMDVSDEHEGMLVQGNVGYKWKASDALVVTPNVFLTYADDDYMDTYFGVNAKNVGTSGLPAYEAESGLKDVGTRIVVSYTPWEKWGVMGILSYKALLEDAKDSPLVDDEGDDAQTFFGLMATYRWGN